MLGGPLKQVDRILRKAKTDYDNDFTRVLDVIRGSGIFHSISSLNAAVTALRDPDCELIVLRVKDRVNKPSPSGYRDVLVNLRLRDSDTLIIVELQLHLQDIVDIKVNFIAEPHIILPPLESTAPSQAAPSQPPRPPTPDQSKSG